MHGGSRLAAGHAAASFYKHKALLPQPPHVTNQCVTTTAQTGRSLDKKLVELPEISTLGTYDASIRLHPEVSGVFKLVIVKDKTGL